MKKVLLTFAVLGTIFLSACDKEENLVPTEKTLLKADKGISCAGCGQWDIAEPAESSSRLTTYDARPDTVATAKKPITPAIPVKKN